jgi:bis(5'-nucleosyl)-tetraphosphatase (symmetrical)
MSQKQTVAVGDIHGCLEEFEELLKLIQYKKEQIQLVLLGDLLDRGPQSVACVRKARGMGVLCIMGNHEERHIRWHNYEQKRMETGQANPMKRMSRQDEEVNEALTEQDWTWLKNRPLKLLVEPDWWAVHGGCEPRYSLSKQDPKQIVRCRFVNEQGAARALNPDKSQPQGTVYWTEQWRGPESIIYGHCVHSLTDVRHDIKDNAVQCLGIDTGCCFGGHLTAAFFKRDGNGPVTGFDFAQVKAKKKYYQGYGDE